MQIDHDTIMLLVGAGIGLSSSFLTSLFQAWISRREFHRQKEYEKKAELKKITIPTTSEIQMYSDNLSETDKEKIMEALSKIESRDRYSLSIRRRRSPFYRLLMIVFTFAQTHFAIFFFIVLAVAMSLGYLIYKAIMLISNSSPLLLSIIVAIVFFILAHLITKAIRNKPVKTD